MKYVLLILLLFGCSTFDQRVFPEYRKDSLVVTWFEVDTQQQLYEKCRKPNDGSIWIACADISLDKSCIIYTYNNPPMELLGHELLHCFKGRWHP